MGLESTGRLNLKNLWPRFDRPICGCGSNPKIRFQGETQTEICGGRKWGWRDIEAEKFGSIDR